MSQTSGGQRGRPQKPFSECKRTVKYERANKLAESVEFNVEWLQMALDSARRHHNIPEPEITCDCVAPLKHTPESGLAHFMEIGYSRSDYKLLLKDQKLMKCSTYPSYDKIVAVKKQCLAPKEIATEKEIRVSTQSMLNFTAEKLIQGLGISSNDHQTLTLHVSVGFDSSSSHKNPNQAFEMEENASTASHQQLFVTGMTLIALETSNGEMKWLNDAPLSHRSFRPLRLAYEKETDETIIKERDRLVNGIQQLQPHVITDDEGEITVNFHVSFTVMDLKGVNACCGNKATQRCVICLKTQSEYKNYETDYPVQEENMMYGLGLLHCHIRSMEMCLVVAYKSKFGTWIVKDKEGRFLFSIIYLK